MAKQANQGRPWTAEEDSLLVQAVAFHGDKEQWKTIALCVPGRTNKACRKRWLHSLSPSVKKTSWTPEEDQLLISLYQQYPNKWSQIARGIPGRTDDACSKRYREALDPNLKKDDWNDAEDARLVESYARLGGKWGIIGQELNRSGLGCRNRWRLLERRKSSTGRKDRADTPAAVISHGPEDTSSIPRFLAEVWPHFAGNTPEPYWNMPWDSADITVPGFNIESFSTLSNVKETHSAPAENSNATSVETVAASPASFRIPSNSLASNLGSSSVPFVGSVSPNDVPLSTSNDHANGEPHDNHADSETCLSTEHIANEENFDFTDQHFLPLNSPEPSIGLHFDDIPHDQEDIDRPITLPLIQTAVDTRRNEQSSTSAAILINPPRKRQRLVVNTQEAYITRLNTTPLGKSPKLSSNLPVSSDVTILAYACGHHSCWFTDATFSKSRFATSGELLNHFKDNHYEESFGVNDMPFRCGLKDCRKGWKSINGIQYHLQISKAHFQRALSTKKSASSDQSPSQELPSSPLHMKLHRCPYTDCLKEYKQLSGLRYHLLHGHPRNPPTQLEAIPPAIAKSIETG